ncbi:MAG: alpha-E domain-containing protein [Rhodobacter sp.]|nr:alpha-E domain-containing protein [Rhodobacter sp.]
MLGKTAGSLFWMYRYLERAENTSRLVETGQRIALTRASASDEEWSSILLTAAVDQGYSRKYDRIAKDRVIDWMLRDTENPASVLSVMKQARENARAVRTALTHEVWEALNSGWMVLNDALSRSVNERDLPNLLGLVRQQTALVRGTTNGTMLRNDIYDFGRVGTFIECADNTCRILDVKYYVLLPSSIAVGSSIDNAQWETMLRAVSARRGFRMTYGQKAKPMQIVEFLMLDPRMPRSLNFCCRGINKNLDRLARGYGEEKPSQDMARALAERLDKQNLEGIFDYGLHEYIQDILSSLASLSGQIEIDYRFYV